ncbi:MAG: polyribonucleotide nucleotidyltransferase [Acidobacteria bacterium]|nr:polyribonucleotide nucleotidyltransferase [Acidobacteriota bacterium]
MVYKESIEIGGKTLSIETGRLAKQADGAAFVQYGDTVVLVTATSNLEPRENASFFPLTVDYREYTYAAGRIPGGFIKRETRPSEKEVLTSRLIDRPVRPLFPDGYSCDTQVIAMVLSADKENDSDMVAMVGASAALYLSDIPFPNPIAAVRIGLVDGQMVVNPTFEQRLHSQLNIVVAGTDEGILMVEAGALEVSEQVVNEAIQFGHENIKKIVAVIRKMFADMKIVKRKVDPPKVDEALTTKIESAWRAKLEAAVDTSNQDKLTSQERVAALKKEVKASFTPEEVDKAKAVGGIFEALEDKIFRENLIKKNQRPDKRAFDQIRKITCEVSLLPRTHGSAVFTRGETQALVTTTLGTADDQQRLDSLQGESKKRFMLHYNFPPFSVGETGFMRGPGRREIGHGALAERSLINMLPAEDVFPYTMRIVSDILESNGSSSMASVCGATLSMMDAGVPLKAPVAGIAMGLVMEHGKYAILTDIAGAEDHFGDMDFKVAGTAAGITALQMDIKASGITAKIMAEALEQARKARLQILETMLATIAEPRSAMSMYAPRIYSLKIPTDKIREVIGPGGKMIRSIIEQTGVKIDVEDDGRVNIASDDEPSARKAIQIITDLTATAEIGKTYLGKVVRLVEFGAFVEIFPGTDGLLHISEVAEHRVKDIRDELKEGDQVLVKVVNIEGNKIRLSRKALLRDQRAKAAENVAEV